jgi:hypothetical protein
MAEKQTHPRLNFRYFFNTFLICAFPLHLWALLMVFNDLEFIAERTDMWDAVGYAGYALLFVLVESLLLAAIVWGASLLLPRSWSNSRTLLVSGSVFIILAGASIVDMAFFVFPEARISRQYFYGLENFTTLTYGLIFGAVLLAAALAIFLILRTKWGEKAFREVFDRMMLLSYFYLVLDAAGIVIVLLRNLSEKL